MVAGEGQRGATGAGVPERLLVAILALGAVAAPYLFRSLDDNRLTSWRWVFAGTDPARLFALVAAAVLLAHLAARSRLPGRRPAAVLFLSSCAAAACLWGEPEAIVDASRYFTQAKHLELYGPGHFLAEWGRGIPAWTDLPLVPFLYGLVFRLFGESRAAIQALTTLLFAASVVLTQWVGSALWDEEVGFTAGALLLAIPYLLTQVPSMLVDVPTMFFFLLAVFAVIHALRRGGIPAILLASLAVFLAFFSKYSTWLLLSVLPVTGVVLRRGSPRTLRTGALVALISGSLVAAALLLGRRPFSQQIALLLEYQAPGLRRWGESPASTFLFQAHPFLSAAALLSVWLALRRRDPRYAIVAWPVLLLLALQVQRIRYWIPAFPMLASMGAYGLQAIAGREIRRFVVACAVASSLVVAGYGYLPFLQGTSAMNLKRAGEYLDSLDGERVEVLTLSRKDPEVNPAVSVPILDLFTAKKLIYRHDGSPPPSTRRTEKSPLRFTWEYRNPAYYAPGEGGPAAAVAVISDDLDRPLPEEVASRLRGHRLARQFDASEDLFQHRTLVRVYRLAPATSGTARGQAHSLYARPTKNRYPGTAPAMSKSPRSGGTP